MLFSLLMLVFVAYSSQMLLAHVATSQNICLFSWRTPHRCCIAHVATSQNICLFSWRTPRDFLELLRRVGFRETYETWALLSLELQMYSSLANLDNLPRFIFPNFPTSQSSYKVT